ncbi:MAG: hypothetical protein HY908_24180 [Myxococcales bacterium]|nr:hypothetical protein [Myxococcales bacterium]
MSTRRRRLRRATELVLGLGLVAAGAVALPLALAAQLGLEDLHVRVAGSASHLVVAGEAGPRARPAGPSAVAAPAYEMGPASLLPRLELGGELDWHEPGLALRRWRAVYGARWEREVALPLFVGPFVARGALDACGLAVHVNAALFDPSRGATGLRAMVAERLRPLFPFTIGVLGVTITTLPALDHAELALVPRDGHLTVRAVAHLADGTEVGASGVLDLTEANGRLVVRPRGAFEPIFEGAGRARTESFIGTEIVNLVRRELFGKNESIVMAEARGLLAAHIAPVMTELNAALGQLGEPFAPFPERPSDTVTLRLAGPPRVTPGGVGLRLCAGIDLGAPLVDATVPGPPRVVAVEPVPSPRTASEEPQIEIVANALAVNQLAFALWQSGQLRRLGQSSLLLDQLPAEVSGLAFDIEGFDPLLPPVVLPRSDDATGALRVRVADVALGRWEERRVVGAADLDATLVSHDRQLRLAGRIREVHVACARERGGTTVLTPCLSDLLPTVRELLRGEELRYELDLGPLLELVSKKSFEGLRLELGAVSATTEATPPQVRARFGARVVGTAGDGR